jgi:hypothetical protein
MPDCGPLSPDGLLTGRVESDESEKVTKVER